MAYPAWNTSQFYVSRANLDLEGGEATDTQTVVRGVAGLNGDFSFASRNFNWEVSVSYGTSDNTEATPSYVFQNVANALNATRTRRVRLFALARP